MKLSWLFKMPWYVYLIVGVAFWGTIAFVLLLNHKRVKRFIEELLDWDRHTLKQQLGRRVSINENVETRFILEDNSSQSGSQQSQQQGWSEQWSSQVRPPSTFTKKIIGQIFEKKTTTVNNQRKYDKYMSNLESGVEVFTESDVELKEMVVVPTTLSLKMNAADLSRGYYIGNYDNVATNPLNTSTTASNSSVTSASVDLYGRTNAPLHRTSSSLDSSSSTPLPLSISSSVGLQAVCKDIDASLSLDFPGYSRSIHSERTSQSLVSSQGGRSGVEVVISPSGRFPPVDPLNLTFIGNTYQNAETTHSAVSSALTSARSSRAHSFDSSQVSTTSTVQQLRTEELHERLSELARLEEKVDARGLFIATDISDATSPTKRRFISSFPHHGALSPDPRMTLPSVRTDNLQQNSVDLKYTPMPMSPPISVKSRQIKQSLAPVLSDSQIKQALRSPLHSPSFVHFAYKSMVHDEVAKARLISESAVRLTREEEQREGRGGFSGLWQHHGTSSNPMKAGAGGGQYSSVQNSPER